VRRAALAAAVVAAALGCEPATPAQDPIAMASRGPHAATRAAAADLAQHDLGGSGSVREPMACGDERWVRFRPDPHDRGELVVWSHLASAGRPAQLDVTVVDAAEGEIASAVVRVAATAPARDRAAIPLRLDRRAPRPLFVRVRALEPCAPLEVALWFREAALVGP
jgi:hypothetical protein